MSWASINISGAIKNKMNLNDRIPKVWVDLESDEVQVDGILSKSLSRLRHYQT
jgi:urease alpha subunit